jgi:hypothetical protein
MRSQGGICTAEEILPAMRPCLKDTSGLSPLKKVKNILLIQVCQVG